MMRQENSNNTKPEKRSEERRPPDKYYSVQFSFDDMGPTYLFKLRDMPLNGLCILVKEDSSVLNQLEVGDILNMEYNPPGSSDSSKRLKTQITSKNSQDSFTGHSLVGLSIVDQI